MLAYHSEAHHEGDLVQHRRNEERRQARLEFGHPPRLDELDVDVLEEELVHGPIPLASKLVECGATRRASSKTRRS